MTIYREKYINKTNYFLVFLLIAGSSQFSDEYRPIFWSFSLIVTLFFYFKKGIHLYFEPPFVFLIFFYATWNLMWFFKFDAFYPLTIFGIFIRTFLAYFIIKYVGSNFFNCFYRIVFILSLLSLPLFALGKYFPKLILPIYRFFIDINWLSIDSGFGFGSSAIHLLFYTFRLDRLHQNHGFMWEPGAFAAMIIIAMIIHIVIYSNKINLEFFILLVALLTTFSTLGYICFMIVLSFKIYKSNHQLRLPLTIIIPVIGLFFYQLDFIGKKLDNEYKTGINIKEGGNTRYSSTIFDLYDFRDNFIIGVGMNTSTRTSGYQRKSSHNGITDYLAIYGIIGITILIYYLLLSSKKFFEEHRSNGFFFLFFAFFLVNISEKFFNMPLFLACQFYFFTSKVNPCIVKNGEIIQKDNSPSSPSSSTPDRSVHFRTRRASRYWGRARY